MLRHSVPHLLQNVSWTKFVDNNRIHYFIGRWEYCGLRRYHFTQLKMYKVKILIEKNNKTFIIINLQYCSKHLALRCPVSVSLILCFQSSFEVLPTSLAHGFRKMGGWVNRAYPRIFWEYSNNFTNLISSRKNKKNYVYMNVSNHFTFIYML